MTVTFRHEEAIPVRRGFAGVSGVDARYREDGELLVLNRGDGGNGFAVCQRCGYADSEPRQGPAAGRTQLPAQFATHRPSATRPARPAGGRTSPPVWRHQVLAARQTTDVLLLEFPVLGNQSADAGLMNTVGFALQRAACRLLELDPREIGVMVIPAGLTYATVHKHRQNGRVVAVSTRLVFGTWFGLLLALAMSAVSRVVNAAFVERHNGTDRGRCSRKVRKTAGFSKDWRVHTAATRFSYFNYNFCWPVRTLRVKGADGRWQSRTPAMAAGLTDHVWSIREWITFPAVQRP